MGEKKLKQFLVKFLRIIIIIVASWICGLVGWESVDVSWFPDSELAGGPSAFLVKDLMCGSPFLVCRLLQCKDLVGY